MAEKDASDSHAGGEQTGGAKKPPQRASEFTEFERLISHEYNADYEETDLFPGEEDGSRQSGYSMASGQGRPAAPLRPGEVRNVRIPLTIASPEGGSVAYELGLSITLQSASDGTQEVAVSREHVEDPPEDEIDLLDGRTTLMFGDQDEDGDDEPESAPEPARGWWAKLSSFWR